MPTNGIILLAKTVNACATDAIGAILRDDSQGLIPFLCLMQRYIQGECPRLGQPLNCASKEKRSQKASERLAERSAQAGPNK